MRSTPYHSSVPARAHSQKAASTIPIQPPSNAADGFCTKWIQAPNPAASTTPHIHPTRFARAFARAIHPSHHSNRSSSFPRHTRLHREQCRSSPDPPVAPLTPTPSPTTSRPPRRQPPHTPHPTPQPTHPTPPTTASANAAVPSVPPMSRVRATPSLITALTAPRIRPATPSCPT